MGDIGISSDGVASSRGVIIAGYHDCGVSRHREVSSPRGTVIVVCRDQALAVAHFIRRYGSGR